MDKNSCLQAICSTSPKIQLNLNNRNMTLLHRAGIAGLWMTLKQLEEKYPSPTQRSGQLSWTLSSHSIDLCWDGVDLDVLNWLLKESFQIDDQGLIHLTGLATQMSNLHCQIAVHQGITGTFLQHTQNYESSERGQQILEFGDQKVAVFYKKLTAYTHQKFAECLCDKQGRFLQKPVRIVKWLYPGAVRTHNALGEHTKFESNPEDALALLFAPIACWYFMLSSGSINGEKQYALVIPEVNDLATYAECDRVARNGSYENFWAANSEDAALQFLMLQKATVSSKNSVSKQCQSVLFGKTRWAKQQVVRLRVGMINAKEETIFHYQLSCKHLSQNSLYKYEKTADITVSSVRGVIAENLAKELPWWFGFSEHTISNILLNASLTEKEGLSVMVEESQWNDQTKKLFVKACHEALKRIYAKMYDRTPEDEDPKIERRNIRIRSELGRCKNAITLRSYIGRFFSEAGQVPILQEHWEELLPIATGEVDWKATRDLMLLALCSYKASETSGKNS